MRTWRRVDRRCKVELGNKLGSLSWDNCIRFLEWRKGWVACLQWSNWAGNHVGFLALSKYILFDVIFRKSWKNLPSLKLSPRLWASTCGRLDGIPASHFVCGLLPNGVQPQTLWGATLPAMQFIVISVGQERLRLQLLPTLNKFPTHILLGTWAKSFMILNQLSFQPFHFMSAQGAPNKPPLREPHDNTSNDWHRCWGSYLQRKATLQKGLCRRNALSPGWHQYSVMHTLDSKWWMEGVNYNHATMW